MDCPMVFVAIDNRACKQAAAAAFGILVFSLDPVKILVFLLKSGAAASSSLASPSSSPPQPKPPTDREAGGGILASSTIFVIS
ncbi:hypothetical protein CFP56_032157 [Quercus suber]|uniref:Uncharacterized protein n=1 Tax=Quercus suber TaxID=58331 RepID=A0AAW0JID3_QUESU